MAFGEDGDHEFGALGLKWFVSGKLPVDCALVGGRGGMRVSGLLLRGTCYQVGFWRKEEELALRPLLGDGPPVKESR